MPDLVFTIHGKVIQQAKDGLLVESGTVALKEARELDRQLALGAFDSKSFNFTKTEFPLYWGWVLLTDHKQEKHWRAGDIISANAYPNGMFEYAAISGAKLVVPRFTCDATKQIAPPSADDASFLEGRKLHNIRKSLSPSANKL